MKVFFGQNFLKSKYHLEKILNIINNSFKEKKVIEIGPGGGAFSRELLNYDLTLIEIDKDLIYNLEQLKHISENNIEIVNKDFTKLKILDKSCSQFFSNLPYHLAVSIILKCREFPNFKVGVFIFQKEIVDKIFLKKNSKIKFLFETFFYFEKGLEIPGTCFFPKVKVNGRLIVVWRKDSEVTEKMIKNSKIFSSRRKKLKNVVKIEKYSSLLEKRLEELSFDEITKLILEEAKYN